MAQSCRIGNSNNLKGKTIMSSKKPKKQRKEMFLASLKDRKKFVKAHLSKELKKELGLRSITVRKGDTVKIFRGGHKASSGKVLGIDRKKFKVFIEGLKVKKSDGTEKPLGIRASNLIIIDIDRNDEKRFKKQKKAKKEGK